MILVREGYNFAIVDLAKPKPVGRIDGIGKASYRTIGKNSVKDPGVGTAKTGGPECRFGGIGVFVIGQR